MKSEIELIFRHVSYRRAGRTRNMFYADHYCSYSEERGPEGHFYLFRGKCKQTGKPYSVKVPADALYAYRRGALIQDAMPMVSKDDREFLISGYSPEGWTQIFGSPEDPDDEDESDETETPSPEEGFPVPLDEWHPETN